MLLVTTADQRFWKTDTKILFLGDWCRRYSQKHVWSQLDHEVLPFHWDNREKLYQDYQFLGNLHESCLARLASKLNDLHGTDFPLRYWRILIGPRLIYSIQVLYERYLSICEAEKSGKVSKVLLPTSDSAAWIAKGYAEFTRGVYQDPFNQYLYSEIIRFLKNLPYEITDTPSLKPSNNVNTNTPQSFTKIAQTLLRNFGRLLPDKMNEVVFVHSYIKPIELARLQISLGQIPGLYPPTVKTKLLPINNLMREKINFGESGSPFESLLYKLIPALIPTVYVEGYQDMHQRSLHTFPGKPKVIYTTNGFYGNEGFNFWASWQVTRGTKLVTSQHGGHYGILKWSAHERHELKITDKHFTWGWEKQGQPLIAPMASGQLKSKVKHLKAKANGNILWVGMSTPLYPYWLFSSPMGPQFASYFMDQKRFAGGVSDGLRRLLVYRLYGTDFGWNQKKRLTDMMPSIKIYDGQKSYYQQLNEARLCISTYNSTTYLETFAANFPSLLFWDPDLWELRSSAQPYFDELREVGILHDTPESAAIKANSIYTNPMDWWQSADIQKVRKRFCDRFARISTQWVSEWRKELQKVRDD